MKIRQRCLKVALLSVFIGCSAPSLLPPQPTMTIAALSVPGGLPLTVDLQHPCDVFVHAHFSDELLVFQSSEDVVRFSVSNFRSSVISRDWHFSPPILPDDAYYLFERLDAKRPGCATQATYVLLDASLFLDGTILKDVILLAQRYHAIPVMLSSGPGAPLDDELVIGPSMGALTGFDRATLPIGEMRLSAPRWMIEVGSSPGASRYTIEQLLLRGVNCVNGPWYALPSTVSDNEFASNAYSHHSVPSPEELPPPVAVQVYQSSTVYVMAFVGPVSVPPPKDARGDVTGRYYAARAVAGNVCAVQGAGNRSYE